MCTATFNPRLRIEQISEFQWTGAVCEVSVGVETKLIKKCSEAYYSDQCFEVR